jgi:hypothetical protein
MAKQGEAGYAQRLLDCRTLKLKAQDLARDLALCKNSSNQVNPAILQLPYVCAAGVSDSNADVMLLISTYMKHAMDVHSNIDLSICVAVCM